MKRARILQLAAIAFMMASRRWAAVVLQAWRRAFILLSGTSASLDGEVLAALAFASKCQHVLNLA